MPDMPRRKFFLNSTAEEVSERDFLCKNAFQRIGIVEYIRAESLYDAVKLHADYVDKLKAALEKAFKHMRHMDDSTGGYCGIFVEKEIQKIEAEINEAILP